MPKATIISEHVDYKICKCQYCGREFKITHNGYWRNHFYCSAQCGHANNECKVCGGNRNWCECREIGKNI